MSGASDTANSRYVLFTFTQGFHDQGSNCIYICFRVHIFLARDELLIVEPVEALRVHPLTMLLSIHAKTGLTLDLGGTT